MNWPAAPRNGGDFHQGNVGYVRNREKPVGPTTEQERITEAKK